MQRIKNVKGKKALAELDAKKAEYQKLFDTKTAAQQKKTLAKRQVVLQKQLNGIPVKPTRHLERGCHHRRF